MAEQSKIELIDLHKDIASVNEKLEIIAYTLVIVASFGIGYILGSKYVAAQ